MTRCVRQCTPGGGGVLGGGEGGGGLGGGDGGGGLGGGAGGEGAGACGGGGGFGGAGSSCSSGSSVVLTPGACGGLGAAGGAGGVEGSCAQDAVSKRSPDDVTGAPLRALVGCMDDSVSSSWSK